jgi:YfiH family protein
MTAPTLNRTGEVTLMRFPHLAVPHGVATRLGGVSDGPYASLNLGPRSGDDINRVRTNRARFLGSIGADGATLVAPRQVHSAELAILRAGEPAPSDGVFDGDGIVTDAPETALMVLAADCAALLLHEPERGVIAAVHAGWRGTAGGIAIRAVSAMIDSFGCDPGAIRVAIGPSIGICCYQVGPEVIDAVLRATPNLVWPVYEPDEGNRFKLNLAGANRAQLIAAGVAREHIRDADTCTACHTELFFSHRREGEPTGRNGAAIVLPAAATG